MNRNDTETTVNSNYSVTVPASIREEVDLEPGDKLRWTVTEDGRLVAEVIRERNGALDDFEPADTGEETDAVELEDEFGAY